MEDVEQAPSIMLPIYVRVDGTDETWMDSRSHNCRGLYDNIEGLRMRCVLELT